MMPTKLVNGKNTFAEKQRASKPVSHLATIWGLHSSKNRALVLHFLMISSDTLGIFIYQSLYSRTVPCFIFHFKNCLILGWYFSVWLSEVERMIISEFWYKIHIRSFLNLWTFIWRCYLLTQHLICCSKHVFETIKGSQRIFLEDL